MEYPLKVEKEGVKINPDGMEKERLYHCHFQDNILLIFKDHQDLLNCFEISDRDIVNRIVNGKQEDAETILDEYIKENKLGKK